MNSQRLSRKYEIIWKEILLIKDFVQNLPKNSILKKKSQFFIFLFLRKRPKSDEPVGGVCRKAQQSRSKIGTWDRGLW